MGYPKDSGAYSQTEYPCTLFVAPPFAVAVSEKASPEVFLLNPSCTDKDFLLDERAPLI